ncbi:MAG: FAD-dependent oxidoreductase [Syntrophomonadaceae bacterium]|nr:FAD-dependent oxidoreductase [Syntrophomonadaceae bacterium]
MKSTDVLIIGGSAAGLSSANSIKTWYPDKQVTVVRDVSYTVVPCGIPYIYGMLKAVEKDKIPDDGFLKKGIEFIIARVSEIDRTKHVVAFADGETIHYEKLILAMGASPLVPSIPGGQLENIFPINKDPLYLQKIDEVLQQSKDVAIIGGGFIGVEMAEQIRLKGDYNVTLIEALPHCLAMACEEEHGKKIELELDRLGVKVLTNTRVESFLGDIKVNGLMLSDGSTLDADMVILGIGTVPNIEIAGNSGLKVNAREGIIVDEYLRTSDPDIFACGDCASKFSTINGQAVVIRLASVAASEGLIAASNLYKLNRKTQGALGAFATKVGNVSVGAAGFTERMCKENDIDYYIGKMIAPDRHPGSLPGCTMQTEVKLLFDRKDDRIIGGHVLGGVQAADMVNILALAIQQRLTAAELAIMQYATHPLLTGSPLVYQVMWAAENALVSK